MHSFLFVLLTTILLPPCLSLAQEKIDPTQKEQAISEMTMEDLLNSTIVTPSKQKEKVSDTPAMVSVLTQEDLSEVEPFTLYERLSFLPGIELIETYFGYRSLTFRGLMQPHYNNKTLFMVNGHPLYVPTMGSYLLNQIPQSAIERVEVVRGPSSTLYGTNAYAGVINVITKEPTDIVSGEVGLLGGSYWHNELRFGISGSEGDLKYFLFGAHQNTNGYPYYPSIDENGVTNTSAQASQDFFDFENDYDSLYGGLKFNDWSFNFGFFREKKDKFGLIPTVESTGPRQFRGWLLDLNYNLRFTENHVFKFSVRHDGYEKNELIAQHTSFGASSAHEMKQNYLSHKTGVELNYDGRFLDNKIKLIAGALLDYLKSEAYEFRYTEDSATTSAGAIDTNSSAFLDQPSSYDTAFFTNVQFKPLQWWTLSSGLRVQYNSDYGSFLATNAGMVFSITEKLTAKALFGRAFRGPTFFEKRVDTNNVLYGGDLSYTLGNTTDEGGLSPETINNLDFAFEWHQKGFLASLGYFILYTDDLIERSRTIPAGSSLGNTQDTPSYSNVNGFRIQGIELDVRIKPTRKLNLFWNFSYKNQDDSPHYFASYLSNIGGSYAFTKKFHLGLNGQYVGDRSSSNTRPAAYYLVNAQISYFPYKHIRLAFSVKNLLDDQYGYPEYIRGVIQDEIPGGPGRTFYGSARIEF